MTSIRRKLIFGLLLGLMALLAVSGTMLYSYVNRVLAGQFDVALTAKAQARFATSSSGSPTAKSKWTFLKSQYPSLAPARISNTSKSGMRMGLS